MTSSSPPVPSSSTGDVSPSILPSICEIVLEASQHAQTTRNADEVSLSSQAEETMASSSPLVSSFSTGDVSPSLLPESSSSRNVEEARACDAIVPTASASTTQSTLILHLEALQAALVASLDPSPRGAPCCSRMNHYPAQSSNPVTLTTRLGPLPKVPHLYTVLLFIVHCMPPPPVAPLPLSLASWGGVVLQTTRNNYWKPCKLTTPSSEPLDVFNPSLGHVDPGEHP